MTTHSITPPARYATWDGIADTAMTGVAPAGKTSEQRILELLATPPVALAKRARHRKPNSGKWHAVTKGFIFYSFFAAALTCTAVHPSASVPAFGGISPAAVTHAYPAEHTDAP